MKKTIGILYNANFNESSFETGCGGSDTWVIQISKEFVRHGYHVIVFSQYEDWYIYNSGVEYVPLDESLQRDYEVSLKPDKKDHVKVLTMPKKEK